MTTIPFFFNEFNNESVDLTKIRIVRLLRRNNDDVNCSTMKHDWINDGITDDYRIQERLAFSIERKPRSWSSVKTTM